MLPKLSPLTNRYGTDVARFVPTGFVGGPAPMSDHTVVTEHDVTGHAETNLVRVASLILPWDGMRGLTLFSSCEPCAMCAGAIYWLGVGRVVFGLAGSRLLDPTGEHPGNPTLSLPCRSVFAAGARPTEVVGPLLGAEAEVPHRGFWR